MTDQPPLALSHIERMALDGLAARWRLKSLEQQAIEREFLGEVERRLNLPPGAIGATYVLNQETGAIAPAPPAPPA